MNTVLNKLKQAKHVAIFTGAGVSTLCGIADFRGPQGLYKNPDAERIFDIHWFERDPSVYYKGCRELVYGLRHYQPGSAHLAIARLEQVGVVKGVITQNIDMLHQKSGSKNVYEIHGSPLVHHCYRCGDEQSFEAICTLLETADVARCKVCNAAYKPDITFFGEVPPEAAFNNAVALAEQADLMVVLGSSLTVHPAASLPLLTLRAGGELVIVNAQSTPLDHHASARYPDIAAFATAVLEAWPEVPE